jgi:hypothetical protein
MVKKPTTMLLPVAVLALTACATNEPPRTAGTTVTTVPTTTVPSTTSPGGQQVVVVEPGSASVRGDVRHTVAGRVESINRNASEITVTAADGSKMTLKLPPMAVATIREGDNVSMNVVVQPR